MEKKKINILGLIYFVYKKYYADTRYKWHIYAYLVVNILQTIFPLIYSYLFAKVIDRTIEVVNKGGDISEISNEIIYIGIAALIQVLISNASEIVFTLSFLWLPYLDDEVFIGKYLQIEPQAYEDPKFVNNKNTLSWNSHEVTNSIFAFSEGFASLISVIVSFVAIYDLNPLFSILAIVSVIPAGYITTKFGKKVWNIWSDSGEEKTKYSSYRNSFWGGDFETFQEMYLFGYGKYLLQKAKEINFTFTKKLEKNNIDRQSALTVASIWRNLLTFVVLYYSIKMVLDGELTVGLLTFVVSAYQGFNGHISAVISKSARILSSRNLMQIFYDIQNRENKISSGKIPLPSCQSGVSIEFKNIWFKYPKTKKWIFKDLSFRIQSDEDLAIVGKNGAGKTTLIKILLRIYDVNKGAVLINGVDIKELDMDSYYKVVGVLAQSFNKLGITARDNIHIGDINKTENGAVVEAAKLADVHSTIKKLPLGYESYLTRDVNNGIQLSGGQWQKLAIARAFYRNTKLLVLDEPTSAVDAISEEKIFDNIRSNAQNQTTLIISHRFSTVKKAKKIVVIDEGRIVEQGDHTQLMSTKGLYYEMYTKQSGQD